MTSVLQSYEITPHSILICFEELTTELIGTERGELIEWLDLNINKEINLVIEGCRMMSMTDERGVEVRVNEPAA
jgi:hypothetical protein